MSSPNILLTRIDNRPGSWPVGVTGHPPSVQICW